MGETLGGSCTGPNDLPTKRQKRPNSRLRLRWEETCRDRLFLLSVIVLGKGLDMLPLAMRGIVVAMNGAIHMLAVPMMGKSAFLDL